MLLHVSFPDVLFCFLPLGWLKEEYKDGTQTRLLFLVTCECCTVGKAHPAIVGPASSHSLSFRYRLFLRVATDLQCLKIPPCSKSRHRNIYEGNNPSPPIHVRASPRKTNTVRAGLEAQQRRTLARYTDKQPFYFGTRCGWPLVKSCLREMPRKCFCFGGNNNKN